VAKPYDLRQRSFLFAVDIIEFCRKVADRGFIMRRLAGQLVDAGASVGANLEESVDGQTKPDFITKIFIALKEAPRGALLVASDRGFAVGFGARSQAAYRRSIRAHRDPDSKRQDREV
jgi:four helix bundle protein